MKNSLILLFIGIPFLVSGCNLYGGLSSPSDDNQHLVAARACLDQGDYQCALENYEALSNSYSDTKISEESLNTLAQYNIFSISDLIASLGTSLGGSSSFTFLAGAMATRQITGGTYRSTISTVYNNDTQINNSNLRAFSEFLASLAMFNELLAGVVGAGGVLTASDIVDASTLSACRSSTEGLNVVTPVCTYSGTALVYSNGASIVFTDYTPSQWGSAQATIQELIASAAEATNDFNAFTGGSSSNSGILATITQLSTLPGGSAAVAESAFRYNLIKYLGL